MVATLAQRFPRVNHLSPVNFQIVEITESVLTWSRRYLLADAEAAEDFREHRLVDRLAGYCADRVQCRPDVGGEEIDWVAELSGASGLMNVGQRAVECGALSRCDQRRSRLRRSVATEQRRERILECRNTFAR